jgi:hypothetical protein
MVNFPNDPLCLQVAYHLDDMFGEHYTSVRQLDDNQENKGAKLLNVFQVLERYKQADQDELTKQFEDMNFVDKSQKNQKN